MVYAKPKLTLSFVSEDISGTEEPGSGGALSHTEDEHKVNGNVSVDDIKVGESPRGAEKERSEPSEYADDKSSELSGHKSKLSLLYICTSFIIISVSHEYEKVKSNSQVEIFSNYQIIS